MHFNTFPYYDDFDESKNFVKVLFKPTKPIQARELNTLQSMFYNQLKYFANHMFKNGTTISDGRISFVTYNGVKIGTAASTSFAIEGMLLLGRESGQSARFISRVADSVCFQFMGTGTDGTTIGFLQKEIIDFIDDSGLIVGNVTVLNDPDYKKSIDICIIEKGVFYYNGHFIESARQIIPIGSEKSYEIGFRVAENFITPIQDQTLLDNNTSVMAYLNPGADRYQVHLNLAIRNLTDTDPDIVEDEFIVLVRVEDGEKVFIKQDTKYADIGDMMAKRTYEESGNYTVQPFMLEIKNHLAKNPTDDQGFSEDGDDNNYVAILTPGVGYIRGYRAETIAKTNLISGKARDTKKKEGYVKLFEERTYIRAIPNMGGSVFPNTPSSELIADGSVINLYDGPTSGGSPTGSIIGTMKVADLIEDGLTTDIIPKKIYRYYLTELNIDSGKKLKDVRGLYRASATFAADAFIDITSDTFILYNPGNTETIWELDRKSIKSLRSLEDAKKGSLTYTKRKKVTGVLNSSGAITFKSPTGEFFKPYNSGTVSLLTSAGITNTIILTPDNSTVLPESLSVVLGAGQAGKTLTVIIDVLSTNLAEKKKILTEEVVLKTIPTDSSYELPRSDIANITVNVYDKSDPTNESLWTDITDRFTLFDGMLDHQYVNATITRNAKSLPFVLSSGLHGLRLSYTYYHHSGDAGFFTVDSYVGVKLENIPSYKSKGGKTYKLESCFDFRPLILGGIVQSVTSFPTVKQIAIFDIEYYVSRIDSICLSKNGFLSIQKGISSDNPIPVKLEEDFMTLYTLSLKPYTYSLDDIRIEYKENKRYTMRDINMIEDRLKTVEYYVVLNLLEKSAVDMKIKDLSGLDRFKNGFVVDDFQNFQAGDTNTTEFKAAIDPKRRELRPTFATRHRKMVLDTDLSYGYTNIEGMLYAPFVSEIIDEQPFATKHVSINPYFMTSKKGKVVLVPNNDTWADTIRKPLMQVNVDTGGTAALQAVANYTRSGLTTGEWAETNRTLISSTEVSTSSASDIIQTAVSTITNTTTSSTVKNTFSVDQSRRTAGIDMSSRTNTYDLGDRVTNVAIKPYMRSIDVEFTASSMLPKTKVYAFFDNQAVSAFCRPIDSLFGEQLVTDSEGKLRGIFRIPEGRFFVGEKIFKITGSIENKRDVDLEFTKASTSFFGGGIEVTKEHVELNVVTPVYNYIDSTENKTTSLDDVNIVSHTEVNSTIKSTPIPDVIPDVIPAVIPSNVLIIQANDQSRSGVIGIGFDPIPPFAFTGTEFTVRGLQGSDTVSHAILESEGAWSFVAGTYPISISGATISDPLHYSEVRYLPGNFIVDVFVRDFGGWGDPLAQSFKTLQDRFITGIDVYFAVVDLASKNIFIELRTMKNGYPTSKVLARRDYVPSDIAGSVSENSETPFHVEFQYPVFVQANVEYCFVVGGASPGTRLWVSKLGGKIVNNPSALVETQPSLGSSFRSQNGTTWNAEQFEDLKYRLYGAVFTSTEINLNFNLESETETLKQDPFEVEDGYKTMRIYMDNHGFIPEDEFQLSMFADEEYTISSPSASQPLIGQSIITEEGSATIFNVVKVSPTVYTIKIKDLTGLLITGKTYSCPSTKIKDVVAPEFSGTITTAPSVTINGIDLNELNGLLTVKSVDSIDSFLVELKSVPTDSGRFGGLGVTITGNYRYDIHNTSGTYETYSANESWEFSGIDDTYAPIPAKLISMKTDFYLDRSNKVSNLTNETRKGVKSVIVNGKFTWEDIYITPVFNENTFSTIFVNNRIDNAEQSVIDVKPNSVGRYLPETDPANGSHSYKYVTRTISLAKPANDLRIAFDVFKDVESDFDVYIKTREQYSLDEIDDYNWEMLPIAVKKHSSNLLDRTEYEITASEVMDPLDWSDRTFDTFKLKLVGRTTNPAKPPLFQSLRIIAYT